MKMKMRMSVAVMGLIMRAGIAFADNTDTALGYNALVSNTTGVMDSAFGASSLQSNTTGIGNTGVGAYSLFSNLSGAYNTAVGTNALYSNTSTGNTATGKEALYSNTGGYYNVADGYLALYYNTTGYDNTATGVNALFNNSTGYYNAAGGFYALSSNTTGHQNAGFGYSAGSTNTTGSGNTFIGSQADATTNNLTHATAIGFGARVSQSYSLVLGDDAVNVGIGTTAPTTPLDVNSSTSWLIGRFKNDSTTGDRTAMVRFETGDSTPVMWNMGVGGSGNGIGQANGQFYLESAAYGVAMSVEKNKNIHFYPSGGGSCNLSSGASGWSCSSDRNLKENFTEIDKQELLDHLSAMPITTWNMKGTTVKHVGPVAQDFHAAFNVGEDDTHINTVDANGVSMAAIQALYEIVKRQQQEIDGLKALIGGGCAAGR